MRREAPPVKDTASTERGSPRKRGGSGGGGGSQEGGAAAASVKPLMHWRAGQWRRACGGGGRDRSAGGQGPGRSTGSSSGPAEAPASAPGGVQSCGATRHGLMRLGGLSRTPPQICAPSVPGEGPRPRSPLTSAPSATCAATGKSRSSPSRSCGEKAEPGQAGRLTPPHSARLPEAPPRPAEAPPLSSETPPLTAEAPPPAPGELAPSPHPEPLASPPQNPPPLTPPPPPAPPRISSIPACLGLRTSPGGRNDRIKHFPAPGPLLRHPPDRPDWLPGDPRQAPPGRLSCTSGRGWGGTRRYGIRRSATAGACGIYGVRATGFAAMELGVFGAPGEDVRGLGHLEGG